MSLKDAVRAVLIGKLLKELIAEADQAGRAEALAQLLAANQNLGVKSVDIELPDSTKVGVATLTSPSAGISIDEGAFVTWVKTEHPSEVVQAVRESFRRAVRSRLRIADGKVIDRTTGQIMPWASVRPPAPHPTSFSVRYADGGREAIETAWRQGRLNPLDHLPGRTLPTGGEW